MTPVGPGDPPLVRVEVGACWAPATSQGTWRASVFPCPSHPQATTFVRLGTIDCRDESYSLALQQVLPTLAPLVDLQVKLSHPELQDLQKNASSSTRSAGRTTSAGTGGMWRFYTEDSPGLKVGPVPVLVMSLLFIASVFMLHIWGKYTRS
ncbi:transport Sec61 subunit beta [Pelobates cultripes]|uniref:Transport Sec61 subunit beta n=1 Tax=Pelobates cultripes TaxID=61616 RepID=A0AAD1RYX1_PELCU|nr:transport Sec61 subunit beta [Pelobates cultripes]